MAPTSTALTTKVQSGSPYQLNPDQTLRAAEALLKHIKTSYKQRQGESAKESLLADKDDSGEDETESDDTPIWLVLGTKKHIVDKARLKPGKLVLPHPLYDSSAARICLITADPQRLYKDLLQDPSFPPALSARISRVIGVQKLRERCKSYESRRALAAEYDVFLSDDRVVTLLPQLLGKAFYKGGAKRPVPVSLLGDSKPALGPDGNKARRAPGQRGSDRVGTPLQVARELERALASTPVNLSPSVTASVRIGRASMKPNQLAENVAAAVEALVGRFVPQGWRNVRSLHVKGPRTAALPIWLAEELWVDDVDVLEVDPRQAKAAGGEKKKIGEKKRKVVEGGKEGGEEAPVVARALEGAARPAKKSKKTETTDLSKEIAQRKERLRQEKYGSSEEVAAA